MARSKKKTTSKRNAAGAKKAAKKTTAKKATKSAARKGAAPKGKKETDVERRWREYWECRTALEEAVGAVREIQEQLAQARATEASHRAVFEETKNALKTLLEVEEPGARSSAGGSAPGRSLFSLAADDDTPPPPPPDEDDLDLEDGDEDADEDDEDADEASSD